METKYHTWLLWTQGSYTLVTALWALIDIDSFMMVSGPKKDTWLVKTVSVLLVAISASMLSSAFQKTITYPVIILGAGTAFGLAIIDFYYSSKGTIKWVYALDGIIECIFIIGWVLVVLRLKKSR